MTDDKIVLRALLEKGSDATFLRDRFPMISARGGSGWVEHWQLCAPFRTFNAGDAVLQGGHNCADVIAKPAVMPIWIRSTIKCLAPEIGRPVPVALV